MYRIIFFISFFSLILTQKTYSQTFERISNKEGFNQNTVNAIAQDKYGFLWYATPNGLIRYDGYEFKSFTTQSESEGTISSNNVTSLFLASRRFQGFFRSVMKVLGKYLCGVSERHYLVS